MTKAYLISEKSLKGFIVAENLDATYLTPPIDEAQNIHLAQKIGEKLLDKIVDLVVDGSIKDGGNVEYKRLLDDYITPYLQYKVVSSLVLPLAYKNRNSGVVRTENEYQTNTDMKDANFLRGYYNDLADYYGIRMDKYLSANGSLYPEYTKCSCGTINASKSNNCEIYLD